MVIQYSSKFKKQYKKLPHKYQQKFNDRLSLLMSDPTNAVLRVHPLKGSFSGYWSMNVSGDLRALFLKIGDEKIGDELIIFVLIGTHSEL